ncbi:MAG: aquaporin [Bacteroidota bacterium]
MVARLLTEFIGTFFLVLTIGLTVLIGTEFAPIAIGSALMALIYMGGHVSGAHYNPAVTLAIWMRGKIEAKEVGPYMGAQVLGAFIAAFVADTITDSTLQVMPAAETSLFEFFLLELLFTFLLALVILNVATSKRTEGNDYYGLAIGFTVLAGAFAAGPISGGAFNPAVALGPALADLILGDGASIGGLWVYLVATFAGGALAAVVFKIQNPDDA